MTASLLVKSLVDRGVRFVIEQDRLTVKAPRGVVTETDRIALAEHKAAVMAIVGPAPGLTQCWRARSAEHQAAFARATGLPLDPHEIAECDQIAREEMERTCPRSS